MNWLNIFKSYNYACNADIIRTTSCIQQESVKMHNPIPHNTRKRNGSTIQDKESGFPL